MVKTMLKDGVYCVGVVDWNMRDFHGYVTSRGTSYNAYIVKDEKTVLVDTVKAPFVGELVGNISEIINLEELDYIIVNHVEMDHSSALPIVAKIAKNAKILSTQRGKEELVKHYGHAFDSVETIKSGDTLRLGKKTLKFLEAPMLHWPDSMMTYIEEDKILLPNDAFGQHFASSYRFDDEVDNHILMEEAAKYYANILMLFAPLITKKINEVITMGIPIDIIGPSHGIIWRKNPMQIIQAYLDWSSGAAVHDKVVIVFDTMWESTDKMARAIAAGICSQNVETKILKLRASNNTEAVTEILESKAVLAGSPTLNNGVFPTMGSFMTYITGLKPKDKLWGFFGSYGWGGGAVRGLMEMAKKASFEVYEPTLEIKWVPDETDLKKCFEFGQQFAQKLKSN
ncbi:MAG: flavodoxin domain-containing protein [Candidatus Bathyarchaeota archaeon]|nr:flavodoxin domain-containing protein [Candidatus Termiticorpusculum sp.]